MQLHQHRLRCGPAGTLTCFRVPTLWQPCLPDVSPPHARSLLTQPPLPPRARVQAYVLVLGDLPLGLLGTAYLALALACLLMQPSG